MNCSTLILFTKISMVNKDILVFKHTLLVVNPHRNMNGISMSGNDIQGLGIHVEIHLTCVLYRDNLNIDSETRDCYFSRCLPEKNRYKHLKTLCVF